MEQVTTGHDPLSGIVFLIGFMGSGKSMLCKGVSQMLDVMTVEMDEEIEEEAGMSINEVFRTRGEDYFRDLERHILHRMIDRYASADKMVLISTGGGAPCYFDNMEVMNRSGTTIFLDIAAERLAGRLEARKADRPLIRDKTSAQIKSYVSEILERRMGFYQQAKIRLNLYHDDKELNIALVRDLLCAGPLPDVG